MTPLGPETDDRSVLVVAGDYPSAVVADRLSASTVVAVPESVPAGRVDVEGETDVDADRIVDLASSVDVAVVATPDDDHNLLLAQRLRTETDLEDVVVRVCDPQYRDPLDDLGVETVCAARTIGELLASRFDRLIAE